MIGETPGAGPSRLQTPVTPKTKRRSWFHFGSSSNTPPPPLPTSEIQEELELSPITPRQSKDSTRIPLPTTVDDDVLDIDGHLEPKSTKAKKKKRSKGGTKDEKGEVVRMMDLKPPATARRGSASGSDTSGRTELGIGTVRLIPSLVYGKLTSRHIQKGHFQGQQVIEPMLQTSSILLLGNPQSNNRDSTVPPQDLPIQTKNNPLFHSNSKDLCPLYLLLSGRQHPLQHLPGYTLRPAVQFERLTKPPR
jgi:hypothetical protein